MHSEKSCFASAPSSGDPPSLAGEPRATSAAAAASAAPPASPIGGAAASLPAAAQLLALPGEEDEEGARVRGAAQNSVAQRLGVGVVEVSSRTRQPLQPARLDQQPVDDRPEVYFGQRRGPRG